MEGKHLIVSVSSMPPYVDYILEDGNVILQGNFGQLWTILEERLGFTSEYMAESYGMGVSNFLNKRRDVLLRPSVISSDDIDKFDFTFSIGSTWYELYLKDSDEINSSNSFIRNWSIEIWMLTILTIVLFNFLLYLMLCLSHKFSFRSMLIVPVHDFNFSLVQDYSDDDRKFILSKNWRKKKIEYQKLKNENERSLGNCFTVALGVFCSQGVYLQTDITSVRILILSFLIFGMIMYNAYSALLVSQLTLGERFLPFDTLEEIPDKGQSYALCVRQESYPYLYFTINKTDNELQPKWRNIINQKNCPNDDMINFDFCEPYVAFLETPAVMSEYSFNNINCKMTNLKGRYFYVDFSFMLLKGFEERARKELNREILKFRQVGILSYLREKWTVKEKVTGGVDNQRTQVTFEHIEGVLIVYTFCILFSWVILLLEIVYFALSENITKCHIPV